MNAVNSDVIARSDGASCCDVLIALDTRYLQEKEYIMQMMRSDNVNKWSANKVQCVFTDILSISDFDDVTKTM